MRKALCFSNPDLPLLPQITNRPIFYPNGLEWHKAFCFFWAVKRKVNTV
jgi:hypothetical protein